MEILDEGSRIYGASLPYDFFTGTEFNRRFYDKMKADDTFFR